MNFRESRANYKLIGKFSLTAPPIEELDKAFRMSKFQLEILQKLSDLNEINSTLQCFPAVDPQDVLSKFIAVLPYCETLKDTSSDSKLLRRLVNDEIQPALRLDNASGLGWIVRRTLMSLMMEGLVVVEPLSGLNENFQYGYTSPVLPSSSFNPSMGGKDSHLFSYPSDSPPIAVHDKCSFCSSSCSCA